MNFASIPKSVEGNPFIDLWYNALKLEGWRYISVDKFSFRWIVRNKVDFLFIHWPHLFYKGNRFPAILLRFIFSILRLCLAKFYGTKIIWVVNNIMPHESNIKSLDLLFRQILLKLCDATLGLSACSGKLLKERFGYTGKHINSRHGHYGSWYDADCHNVGELDNLGNSTIKLLLFGAYRKNKNVEEFLDEFEQCNIKGFSLIIAGKWPVDLEERYKNVTFINRFISDNEVADLFSRSDWVVFPYKDYTTSGVFALAVTYKKSVLAHDSEYAKAEVTSGLGIVYRPGELKQALADIKNDKGKDDNIILKEYKKREWSRIAARQVKYLKELSDKGSSRGCFCHLILFSLFWRGIIGA